jgi:hypothetical protein
MSKKDKHTVAEVTSNSSDTQPEMAAPLTPSTPPTPSTAPAVSSPNEKLSEVDKLQLDLARTKRQTALAEAKTALANNEKAELEYKYLILQLYMKYGLTAADALSEAGDIVRGGAIRPQGQ